MKTPSAGLDSLVFLYIELKEMGTLLRNGFHLIGFTLL